MEKNCFCSPLIRFCHKTQKCCLAHFPFRVFFSLLVVMKTQNGAIYYEVVDMPVRLFCCVLLPLRPPGSQTQILKPFRQIIFTVLSLFSDKEYLSQIWPCVGPAPHCGTERGAGAGWSNPLGYNRPICLTLTTHSVHCYYSLYYTSSHLMLG